jgi:hypothetical protein
MEEPLDVYSDQFQVLIGPWGCALNFSLSAAVPPTPGKVPEAKQVATIRMSTEHLKAMAFMIRRQIMEVEKQTGIKAEIPMQVLNSLGIALEDWNSLWNQ